MAPPPPPPTPDVITVDCTPQINTAHSSGCLSCTHAGLSHLCGRPAWGQEVRRGEICTVCRYNIIYDTLRLGMMMIVTVITWRRNVRMDNKCVCCLGVESGDIRFRKCRMAPCQNHNPSVVLSLLCHKKDLSRTALAPESGTTVVNLPLISHQLREALFWTTAPCFDPPARRGRRDGNFYFRNQLRWEKLLRKICQHIQSKTFELSIGTDQHQTCVFSS